MKEGWKYRKLGDCCSKMNGLWKGKKEPFVRVGVIRNANFTKDFRLSFDNVEYLDVEEKQYSTRKLYPGDLIVEKSGGSEKQPVGRTVLFEKENGEYSFSNFTSVLRIKDRNDYTPEFLYKYLLYVYYRGDTKNMQKATTGIHNIEFDKFLAIDVPILLLSEQQRIVSRLDASFAKIDALSKQAEEALEHAKALFQAKLKELMEKKEGWEEKKLGEIGNVKNGMNFLHNESGVDMHLLGVGDFGDKFSIDDTSKLPIISLNQAPNEEYLLKDEDIVFVRSNGNKKLVGRSVLVYPKDTRTSFSGFCIRFRKTVDYLDMRFLVYYLKMPASRLQLVGNGANITNLNQQTLKAFKVLVPSLEEQQQIVQTLDSLSQKIQQLQQNYSQKLANCQALKQALLKETFE